MPANVPIIFTKGIDRSTSPLAADKGSLYVLRNLRHNQYQKDALYQTPYWYNYDTFARGTYYNAGSQTEPATSSIRLVTADLVVTDYVCRGASGQLQVIYQTTYPAAETIYTGCRLVVNSITGLGLNLGATLDVEMTGAAAFRWRKNGGGWTAGVPSTAGVSIDSGTATLYFLASTGFAGTETWSWTRLDRSWASTGTFQYPCEFNYYKGELFFNSVDDRMMVCSSSSTGLYVISVGYRPVVGSYFAFFDDHLVVTWFSKNASGWTGSTRWYTVGWSDKTDIHNFIPTDTNEADQYALPNSNQFDTVGTASPDSYLMGIAVIQNQLFLFTNNEIYWTSALGLPLVFTFQKLMNVKLISTYSAVIRCDFGAYLIGVTDVFFFDGASVQSIGKPIMDGLDNGNFEGSFGCWDPFAEELCIVNTVLLFVYQKRWGTWYTRCADFANETTPVKCINAYSGVPVVGVSSLKLYRDDVDFTSQPVFDWTNGTVYGRPYLVTQILGDDLATVKDLSGVYLGVVVATTGISATYYTTGTSVVVQVSYWLTPGGNFINVSETIPTSATWNSGKPDGIVSLRQSFRGIALALEVQGTVSKPAGAITIQQIVPLIYNVENRRVER